MLILAKNTEIMLFPFSLNLTKTPELLNAANKLRANGQVKADATSRVTSCGNKVPWMKELISRQKKWCLLLKFACNSDLGPKKMVAWSVNNNFVLQNWSKVQLILAVYFSENRWKLCSWWRIMPTIMLSQSRSIKALLGRKEFARDTSHLFQNLFFPYSMILKELTL